MAETFSQLSLDDSMISQPEDLQNKDILIGQTGSTLEGNILGFEFSLLPDSAFIVTHADIPGSKTIKIGESEIPLLASSRVLWKGQPVFACAGDTTLSLKNFLQNSEIKTESVETGSTHIKESLIEKGNTGTAFSEAYQIVEDSITIPALKSQNLIHTTVCIRQGELYHLHTNSQWPGIIHENVCKILHIKNNKVKVRPYSGRCQSQLWDPVMESCIAALLSWKSKRSIKIHVQSQSTEHIPSNPIAEFNIRGSINERKMLSAMEVDITLFCGICFPYEKEFLEQVTDGILGTNPCDNYIIRIKAIYNSTPPSSLTTVAGSEIGFLVGELFTSRIAQETQSNPIIWRRKWLQSGGTKLCESMRVSLNDIADMADFNRKFESYEQIRLKRSQLGSIPQSHGGIGVSCASRKSGLMLDFASLSRPSVTMETNNNGINVETALPNQYGGLTNYWKAIISHRTGIENQKIVFPPDWSGKMTCSSPAVMGGNVYFVTQSIKKALREISDHSFKQIKPIHTKFLSSPYSWGVCVIEITISTTTLEIQSLHIWLIIDAGKIIQSVNARLAIEKSCEDVLQWCGLNNSHLDHHTLNIKFCQNPYDTWSSDVSSLPWILIPAALMQATRQSLNRDVRHFSFNPTNLFKSENIS